MFIIYLSIHSFIYLFIYLFADIYNLLYNYIIIERDRYMDFDIDILRLFLAGESGVDLYDIICRF